MALWNIYKSIFGSSLLRCVTYFKIGITDIYKDILTKSLILASIIIKISIQPCINILAFDIILDIFNSFEYTII